ncbi:unnamed protein product [Merluccius merluccius]
MKSALLLTVYCVSLFTVLRSSAMPVEEPVSTDRSDLLKTLSDQTDTKALISEVQSDVSTTVKHSSNWLAVSLKRAASSNARAVLSSLAWAQPESGRQVLRRSLRIRRNAHHHHHHRQHHHNTHRSKLNKEGCPLGTCSVHNLSHRLYQLIGQSGRENSSPINPNSPHSFG